MVLVDEEDEDLLSCFCVFETCVPLEIDESTKIRTFDHYARILIDLDLSQPIFNNLLVEREGYIFFLLK